MKNRVAKAKRSRRPGLPRPELALALGVSARKVDRLIAAGLSPVGHRGAAYLYNLAGARRLARRLAPPESASSDVVIADLRSHAEDLHDRRRRLLETWIPDTAWLASWRALVATIARVTSGWPVRLAARIGGTPREQARILATADSPRPAPPPPLRHVPPDEVRTLLAGDPAAQPWRLAATPAITRLVESGKGIAIQTDGAWHEWAPAAGVPEPRTWPAPLIRPLLVELSTSPRVRQALAGLMNALAPSLPGPLPPPPPTADAARAQWREARAAFRRARIAVRRGHHRRADLVRWIEAAAREHTMSWWGGAPRLAYEHAGDHAAALARLEQLRRELLARLETLGGLVVPPRTSTPRRPGARKRRS